MYKTVETHATAQRLRVGLGERSSGLEQQRVFAAEAHHRLPALNDDRTRLEDLAEEWIELLRANSRKTTVYAEL